MKNQNLKKKIQSEGKNKEEKGQEDLSQKKNDHAQFYSPQNKSPEKMRIKVDENFQLELQSKFSTGTVKECRSVCFFVSSVINCI